MADILNEFESLLGNENQETQENLEENAQQQTTGGSSKENQEPQGNENEEGNEEGNEENENEPPTYPDNALYTFLQAKGIKDPSKIVFEGEDGKTEELDFNALSVEDQLAVFNEIADPGLSENEINAINYMRQNGNVTLEQIVDYFAQQRLDAYLNEHPEAVHQKVYSIDDYTDDDLYLVDLKQRYPEFTDEELKSKLEVAKANEELFKKEAEVLRNTYKAQEDQAAAEREQQDKQQIEDLRKNLMNAASNFNEIQLDYTDDKSESLEIEEEDKQEMLSYILEQDENGKSQLVRDLEDPDALIELAWLRTKGADVLSNLTQYWKKMLADERATNKKLQAQIDKLTKKGTSSVVIPPDPNDKNKSNGESI